MKKALNTKGNSFNIKALYSIDKNQKVSVISHRAVYPKKWNPVLQGGALLPALLLPASFPTRDKSTAMEKGGLQTTAKMYFGLQCLYVGHNQTDITN